MQDGRTIGVNGGYVSVELLGCWSGEVIPGRATPLSEVLSSIHWNYVFNLQADIIPSVGNEGLTKVLAAPKLHSTDIKR